MLGNHDYESNQQDEILKVLEGAGVTVLDGETTEIHGIGFAGIRRQTYSPTPSMGKNPNDETRNPTQ